MPTLPDIPLPATIRSRIVDNINGLSHARAGSRFRNVRPALRAAAARLSRTRLFLAQGDAGARGRRLSRDRAGPARLWPHHRMGYGLRRRCRQLPAPNLVRDALGLVSAFGYRSVDAVIGHDFGSPVAAWCALIRPDVFRSVVHDERAVRRSAIAAVQHRERARQSQQRKIRSTRSRRAVAAAKALPMVLLDARGQRRHAHAPQGLHDFLRAYYHHKSADWKGNKPYPLKSWTADEIAKLPTYYVMDLAKDMADTVAEQMPSPAEIAANTWLPDNELAFYSRRVCPHRIPGRAAMVSLRHDRRVHARNCSCCPAAPSTCPLLHLRQAGLGHLSAARRS